MGGTTMNGYSTTTLPCCQFFPALTVPQQKKKKKKEQEKKMPVKLLPGHLSLQIKSIINVWIEDLFGLCTQEPSWNPLSR